LSRGVSSKRITWYTQEEETIMKKTVRLLSLVLGIGGIGLLLLAPAVQLSLLSSIGMAMLIVAAGVALVSAFREGKGADTIGSYRIPRT
jgi:hypothetical protein